MNRKRLVIIGAGGFAREVRMLAEDITRDPGGEADYEFTGYLVSDPGSLGPHDSVTEILGDFSWLKENADQCGTDPPLRPLRCRLRTRWPRRADLRQRHRHGEPGVRTLRHGQSLVHHRARGRAGEGLHPEPEREHLRWRDPGKGCAGGHGALLTKPLPAGVTAVGMPGRAR